MAARRRPNESLHLIQPIVVLYGSSLLGATRAASLLKVAVAIRQCKRRLMEKKSHCPPCRGVTEIIRAMGRWRGRLLVPRLRMRMNATFGVKVNMNFDFDCLIIRTCCVKLRVPTPRYSTTIPDSQHFFWRERSPLINVAQC